MSTIVPDRSRKCGSASCVECDRRKRVDFEHVGQHVERVVGEPRLRRRAEHARVVDDEIDAAALEGGELDGRGDQRIAVCCVGDVAGDGAHDARTEIAGGVGECDRVAGVDDEVPAVGGERAGECQTETSGCAGDDCDRHVTLLVLWERVCSCAENNASSYL